MPPKGCFKRALTLLNYSRLLHGMARLLFVILRCTRDHDKHEAASIACASLLPFLVATNLNIAHHYALASTLAPLSLSLRPASHRISIRNLPRVIQAPRLLDPRETFYRDPWILFLCLGDSFCWSWKIPCIQHHLNSRTPTLQEEYEIATEALI